MALALEGADERHANAVVVLGEQDHRHRPIVRAAKVKAWQSFAGVCRSFALTMPADGAAWGTLPGMTTNNETVDPIHLVRDIATRAVLAVGLAGIGLIHLLDAIGKYNETRYLFWMYIGLIVASLATAGAVLFTRSRVVFLAAAGLAGSAIAGFVLTRPPGLPNATGDVGNWTEPLGLASLFVEGSVVALGTAAHAATAVRRPKTIGRLVTVPSAA